MTTLNLTIKIHSGRVDGDKARKILHNLTDLFLAQCLPGFLLPEHWSRELFFYHPDEESEAYGIYYAGIELHLQRTCKSAHRAVLMAQTIQSISLIFDSMYDEVFSFLIDSIS